MKPNWNKAPKGATHVSPKTGMFYKMQDGGVMVFCEPIGEWMVSAHDQESLTDGWLQPRPLSPAAQRAKLAPAMWREFNRLRELRAAGDYLGIAAALPGFWKAREEWRAVS